MKFSVCFKALPFMAPLFLTRFPLQGGFSLKKPHIFPGAVLEVVSFLPWVCTGPGAQGWSGAQSLKQKEEQAKLHRSMRRSK